MNFRRALANAFAAGLLGVSAQGASALFVTTGSDGFGKNSLVVDSLSGLTWLNLDVTAGLSFNEVAGLLENDARYGDFRFASLTEVIGLFVNGGFSVDVPTGDPSDPDRLAAGASFAKAFVGVRSRGTETFRGFTGEPGVPIDPLNGVYSLQVAGVGVKNGSKSAAIAFTDEVFYFSPDRYAGVGSWLVYDPVAEVAAGSGARLAALSPVTPVPEPSAYALMCLGLMAVAAATRRRRPAARADHTAVRP